MVGERINGGRANRILTDCIDFDAGGETYYIPSAEVMDYGGNGKFSEVYRANIGRSGTELYLITDADELEVLRESWIGKKINSIRESKGFKKYLDKIVKTTGKY
jgi:hypothetical protein|tara:strand:+ start:461 stop:772 length:312 start_codon:yes stop_codon:yes gene_type:complete